MILLHGENVLHSRNQPCFVQLHFFSVFKHNTKFYSCLKMRLILQFTEQRLYSLFSRKIDLVSLTIPLVFAEERKGKIGGIIGIYIT